MVAVRPPRMNDALSGRVDDFTTAITELAREIVRHVLVNELENRRPAVAKRSRPRLARRAPVRGENSGRDEATHRAQAGRNSWTIESVLDELSTWLLSGTSDAAFVSRHGPTGLVLAAKRFFGRFDAALNAANVRLARRYPRGIPTTSTRTQPAPVRHVGPNPTV